MKLNKVVVIPALALAAGLSLAACGSAKAPSGWPTVTHTVAPAARTAPAAHLARPAPAATTPVAAPKAAAAPAILSVTGYSGTSPGEVNFSGDASYIITNITWSWGASEASGTGISDIQGCVPGCATGSETPYGDTIVLSDVHGGQFTRVSSTRDGTVTAGSTSLIVGAEQASGNSSSSVPAPAASAGLTDCGGYLYVGPDTSCPFAQNVESNYTGLGADYASSPVTGQNYTMNCVAGYGNLNGGDSVVCTGGDNALVEWGAN
jgi:hypothetical protein